MKHMNYKKIITAILLTTAGIIGLFVVQNCFQKSITQQITSSCQLLKLVNEQEINAWKAMETLGITKEECYKKVSEWEKEYQQSHPRVSVDKNLSKSIVQLIKELLVTYGVNPAKVTLERYDNGLSAAGATNDTICVNQQKFNSLPADAQRFVIAHEIQHIIYKDAIVKEVLKDHLKIKSTHTNVIDSPLNQLSRFFEIRADVMASLKNPAIADGYVKRAHLWLTENGYNPGTSHPKHEERLALAQQITQVHQQSAPTVA